jgi:energy-coupling factor transport system ATP-binding protein
MLFARTVREELLFGPRNMRLPDDDGLAMEALERASLQDVPDILDRPPMTLSFGQQKRLALAIALAMRPPTLILDEPSAGQDHGTAARFMDAVGEIPGLESLYFVTHDVDLALVHADRILVLRDGRIAADGTPGDVVRDEQRWVACNLRRTSLMAANLAWNPGGRFRDALALARGVVERERDLGVAARRDIGGGG